MVETTSELPFYKSPYTTALLRPHHNPNLYILQSGTRRRPSALFGMHDQRPRLAKPMARILVPSHARTDMAFHHQPQRQKRTITLTKNLPALHHVVQVALKMDIALPLWTATVSFRIIIPVKEIGPRDIQMKLHTQACWLSVPPAPPLKIPLKWRLLSMSWTLFWKLPIPLEVFTVWWRLLHGFLPTKSRLLIQKKKSLGSTPSLLLLFCRRYADTVKQRKKMTFTSLSVAPRKRPLGLTTGFGTNTPHRPHTMISCTRWWPRPNTINRPSNGLEQLCWLYGANVGKAISRKHLGPFVRPKLLCM
ncbi:hypothetical protein [Absidia glauca]|uniref:Uncharacterized protein n=1 Tax=Absidia glauca TaxID=4829 RepID=A0A163IXY2_ABSGL|nr:hypothetical protein [Absidia glauca]